MNILITGGLGNVGMAVTQAALEKGWNVTVVVHSASKKNRKRMKLFKKNVKFIIGSITDKSFVHSVMKGIDCIVHLAAILPPKSEESYERTFAVNVTGTRNILDAIDFHGNNADLIYASSTSVYGPTQDKTPPLGPYDETHPINNYTDCKVKAETLLHDSNVRYCILRLASVMTEIGGFELSMIKYLFEFPPYARNELVFIDDAATAIINCAQLFLTDEDKVLQNTFIIAGGSKNGCQMTNKQMVQGVFESLGLKPPADDCFINNTDSYFMDWYDTRESQRVLNYQNTTFEEYKKDVRDNQGKNIPRFLSLVLASGLGKLSPYKNKNTNGD